MLKLAVTNLAAIRAALRHEGKQSSQSRFLHRLHYLLLVGTGRICYEVAKVFGDSPRSVERWVREFQQRGIEGLRDKPHTGRHATLADAQLRQLALVFRSSPRQLGYEAEVWSNKLLRAKILQRFSVATSVRHCQRLFRVLQQSPTPSTPDACTIASECGQRTPAGSGARFAARPP